MSECKIPTSSTDCISRQAVIDLMMQKWGENFSGDDAMQESIDAIRVMPSVTPPLSSGLEKNSKKLEKNFGELDCISRDSAIKALDYDIKCFEFKSGVSKHMDDIAKLLNTIYETQVNNIKVLPSVTAQEPILDKLRAEIIENSIEDYKYHGCGTDELIIETSEVLRILDKYKAESEG